MRCCLTSLVAELEASHDVRSGCAAPHAVHQDVRGGSRVERRETREHGRQVGRRFGETESQRVEHVRSVRFAQHLHRLEPSRQRVDVSAEEKVAGCVDALERAAETLQCFERAREKTWGGLTHSSRESIESRAGRPVQAGLGHLGDPQRACDLSPARHRRPQIDLLAGWSRRLMGRAHERARMRRRRARRLRRTSRARCQRWPLIRRGRRLAPDAFQRRHVPRVPRLGRRELLPTRDERRVDRVVLAERAVGQTHQARQTRRPPQVRDELGHGSSVASRAPLRRRSSRGFAPRPRRLPGGETLRSRPPRPAARSLTSILESGRPRGPRGFLGVHRRVLRGLPPEARAHHGGSSRRKSLP